MEGEWRRRRPKMKVLYVAPSLEQLFFDETGNFEAF